MLSFSTLTARPLRSAAALLPLVSAIALLAASAGPAAARVTLRPVRASSATTAGPSPRAGAFQSAMARAASLGAPLTPSQLHTAYGLPRTGARGQTIAILNAYDDPYVEHDLNAFLAHYHLPACTLASGCLRQVNEQGAATPLPPADPTGGQFITEAAVGAETARATCQSCKILLVEAASADRADLSAAADAAAADGATVAFTALSMTESSTDSDYSASFLHPHTAYVAAAGDAPNGGTYGYAGLPNYPAVLPGVLAVGGTTLSVHADGSYGSEQAWTGTYSGCSLFKTAAPWQRADAAHVGCGAFRANADLATLSEPGVYVYVTGSGDPGGPWFSSDGTSVAAPIVAGMIGLAGSLGAQESEVVYRRSQTEPSVFHDIVAGSNSLNCKLPICAAGRGYDGPTGLGSPYGLGAFLPNGGALQRGVPRVSVMVPGHGLSVDQRGRVELKLTNANPVGVTGRVRLYQRIRANGHTVIVGGSAPLSLAPLGHLTVTLTIPAGGRSLFMVSGGVRAHLDLSAKGPTGRAVKSSRIVTVR